MPRNKTIPKPKCRSFRKIAIVIINGSENTIGDGPYFAATPAIPSSPAMPAIAIGISAIQGSAGDTGVEDSRVEGRGD